MPVAKKKTETKTVSKRVDKETKIPKRNQITKKSPTNTKKIDEKTKVKTPKVKTIQDYVMEFADREGLAFDSTHAKGIAFEKFILDLFGRKGYKIKVAETPPSGDHGVDLVISRVRTKRSDDIWGGNEDVTINYMVQCKYKGTGSIGSPIIRDLIGAVNNYSRYKNKQGMCITTVSFTFGAKEEARKGKVELFDGKKLLDMVENDSIGKVKKKKKSEDDFGFWW